MKRVVVTGLGVINAAGHDPESFFDTLLKGKSVINKITRFDLSDQKVTLAAEDNEFDPTLYIDKKEARRTDRYCQFALAGALDAFRDSGLDKAEFNHDRAGVIFGSGVGGILTLEEEHSKLVNKGPSRISPFFIPMMI